MPIANYKDIYETDSLDINTEEMSRIPWYYMDYKKEYDGLLQELNLWAAKMREDMQRYYYQSRFYVNFYEVDYLNEYEIYRSKNNLRQSWNLMRVSVDGHYNRICRISPKITLLTKGDKIEMSQLAQKTDDWLLHLFNSEPIHKEFRSGYKDGILTNLGWSKIVPEKDGKTFTTERKLPFCIAVEEPFIGSGYRSQILEFGLYRICDVYEMIKDQGNQMALEKFKKVYNHKSTETIMLNEIYKAGMKKAVFTNKCILEFSKWKYKWLPYQSFVWDRKMTGIVGTGVSEIVCPTQNKINGLLYRIDQNTELFTNQYIILPRNSDFSEMDNGFGRFYEANLGVQGSRPHHVTPPILHEQVFKHLNDTYQMGLRTARLSDLQAEGSVPKGLSQPSGKALEYYNDIDQSRFFVNITEYEMQFVNFSKKILEWGSDIYPDEEPFKSIKKDKEQFFKRVNKFTGNLLPETPVGRMQVLSQLVTLGIIRPEKFMELLDSPDVSGFLRSESSRISAIEKYLENQFFKGKTAEVDPVLGYEEQREVALKIYSRILKEGEKGIDDPRLENVRGFIKSLKPEIDRIKKEQMQHLLRGRNFGGEVPDQGGQSPNPNNQAIALKPKLP